MKHNPKVLGLLGLAMRAGQVVSGEEGVLAAIKSQKVQLVLIAEDASQGTKKKFTDKSSYRDIPHRILFEKEVLGHAIGKKTRAVIGIVDPNFAKKMLEMIDCSH
ncbi:L7Ae/L30e/S12e/Gadd45 family ribosomal protein [Isachenkonia alkalipeptolytica]|uniref:50S ribosomal protein L7ae n=1 Tax=Isachenkonia alkalipeptolytica TaxID=2565777 RepID=A0AA44BEJ9_9CLOT|nr:ribosomal L7Ae/L30e/S12e/Gadd45 family protein [Isachenkonia alkalipeptolytica]NBG87611.1 50S ribosomal protein L7ae [Isachenkonia alkalipeptolytica]